MLTLDDAYTQISLTKPLAGVVVVKGRRVILTIPSSDRDGKDYVLDIMEDTDRTVTGFVTIGGVLIVKPHRIETCLDLAAYVRKQSQC